MFQILCVISSLGEKWTTYAVQIEDRVLLCHLTDEAIKNRVQDKKIKLTMGDMSKFNDFVPQAFFKV